MTNSPSIVEAPNPSSFCIRSGVAIFTGTGPAFCAGEDTKGRGRTDPEDRYRTPSLQSLRQELAGCT